MNADRRISLITSRLAFLILGFVLFSEATQAQADSSKQQDTNKKFNSPVSILLGSKAPDIIMHDADNKQFELYSYQTNKKFILILFWSAGCSHCKETVDKLYPLYLTPEVRQKLDVIAISIDVTEDEINSWKDKIEELWGWTHMRVPYDLRSKIGNDYKVFSVPIMVLLNAKTKEIVAIPESTKELNEYLIK